MTPHMVDTSLTQSSYYKKVFPPRRDPYLNLSPDMGALVGTVWQESKGGGSQVTEETGGKKKRGSGVSSSNGHLGQ